MFCHLMLDFYVKTGIRFSLRDKRLFEITEVEITRVDCIFYFHEIPFWNYFVMTIVMDFKSIQGLQFAHYRSQSDKTWRASSRYSDILM